MGRLADYTLDALVFGSRLCFSWQDWRDTGSTATWEVPCEETHRVRHLIIYKTSILHMYSKGRYTHIYKCYSTFIYSQNVLLRSL